MPLNSWLAHAFPRKAFLGDIGRLEEVEDACVGWSTTGFRVIGTPCHHPVPQEHKGDPKCLPQALYRGRARIEQAVGKLKRFKRIALGYEKPNRNFGPFVALAAALILIKSVHTA